MSASESSALFLSYTEKPPCALRIFRDKYVILGTYDLDKPSGMRTGSIEIRDLELHILLKQDLYGAVLDLKLSPFDDAVMVSAHSTGNLQIWHLQELNGMVKLLELANFQVFDPETLITSVHFSPTDPRCVLVTSTTGETRVVDLNGGKTTFSAASLGDEFEKIDSSSIQAQGSSVCVKQLASRGLSHEHALECWTAEFGALSPLESTVFTGGDDSTLAAHDLRSGDVIFTNSRIHEAGVVAIKSSTPTFRTSKPTSIITGSYDDQIRTLDLRMLGDALYPGQNVPPVKSTSLNLGGGVWRFAESPVNSDDNFCNKLLVCCMYDGAKIVSVDDDDKFTIEGYIKKNHTSMCYGGDWSSSAKVTCSFYDKVIQVWE
ncbi:LADA_0A02630g1_1 [Lachancea dasiensis]|uniref:methylated diphthine methylhydrolase n=1 Tax=Lachancea dasiensis TaxID=1072105 RepID=A0A1G4IMI9_9SACH|nr:LADA_0A02630g1_1 [Lachancea dasiensis]